MESYERSGFVGGLLLASAFPMFFYRAYALAVLWGWFLVESIRVEPITTLQAAGIMLAWHLLSLNLWESSQIDMENISWYKVLLGGWFAPSSALGFGWVIKLYL